MKQLLLVSTRDVCLLLFCFDICFTFFQCALRDIPLLDIWARNDFSKVDDASLFKIFQFSYHHGEHRRCAIALSLLGLQHNRCKLLFTDNVWFRLNDFQRRLLTCSRTIPQPKRKWKGRDDIPFLIFEHLMIFQKLMTPPSLRSSHLPTIVHSPLFALGTRS